LDVSKSILKDIRESVGLLPEDTSFDADLLLHINSSIATLNQNGVGSFIMVKDESSTWADLRDNTQIKGNIYFQMVPLYISLSTKLLFDPPPPSSVEFHSRKIEEQLWRLRIAYEKPYTIPTE